MSSSAHKIEIQPTTYRVPLRRSDFFDADTFDMEVLQTNRTEDSEKPWKEVLFVIIAIEILETRISYVCLLKYTLYSTLDLLHPYRGNEKSRLPLHNLERMTSVMQYYQY